MNRIPKVLCVSISYLSVAAVCISQGTGEFISFEAFPDGTAITESVVLAGDEFVSKGVYIQGWPTDYYCEDATAAAVYVPYYCGTNGLAASIPDDPSFSCAASHIDVEFVDLVQSVTVRFMSVMETMPLRAFDENGDLIGEAFGAGDWQQCDPLQQVTFTSASQNIRRVRIGSQASVTDIETIYYEESLDDDPVAYYSFRGNADDQSGNGNHCVVDGPVLAEGIYGGSDGSYVFDGIDDYLDCGNGATINPTAAMSITAWIKPADLSGARIVSKWGIGTGYELDVVSGVVRMILNQTWVCTYDLSGSENRWVHLASVWDGSNDVVLFVNGEAVCTGWFQGPLLPSPNDLLIGEMANFAPSSYFSGSIDEVRIYDRGLSEEEVTALYSLYSGMFNDGFESGDTSAWSTTVGEAP